MDELKTLESLGFTMPSPTYLFGMILFSVLGSLAVPLAQLESMSKDQDTKEAVGDWHYWLAQGYQF